MSEIAMGWPFDPLPPNLISRWLPGLMIMDVAEKNFMLVAEI